MNRFRYFLLLILSAWAPAKIAHADADLTVVYPLGPHKRLALCGNQAGLSWDPAHAQIGKETAAGSGVWKFHLPGNPQTSSGLEAKFLITSASGNLNPIWMSGNNLQLKTNQNAEFRELQFDFPQGKIEVMEVPTRGKVSKRTLRIYTPPEGSAQDQLYALDGENLFERNHQSPLSWRLDQTLDEQIGRGQVRPIQVIGIDAGTFAERMRQYTYIPSPRRLQQGVEAGGEGDSFAQETFPSIVEWVENKAIPGKRVKEGSRAILGSSLGGLEVTYIGLTESPKPVRKVLALSGAFWWVDEDFPKRLSTIANPKLRPEIFMSMGTQEGSNPADYAQALNGAQHARDELVHQLGYQEGKNLYYVEIPGGTHDEPTWAKQIREYLPQAFPVSPAMPDISCDPISVVRKIF